MKTTKPKTPSALTLVYSGRHEAVIVPDAGLTVRRGVPTVIEAELAASLLARPDWAEAKEKAPKESE